MVKKLLGLGLLLGIGLLCALSLLSAPARVSAASYTPAMNAAAQDSTGTVWAIPWNNNSYDSSNDGTVYRWQAGAWTAQSIPGAAGFWARILTRGDDGSVYVLWQKDQGQNGSQTTSQCLVTVHRGVGSRILARFAIPFAPDAPFSSSRLLWAGVGGDLWIAGDSAQLWHVDAQGNAQSFPLTPDERFGKEQPGFSQQSFSSLTDNQGRRWFWESERDMWAPGGLRGFLIWDGKTLAAHATLPGLPDRTFSVVTRQDTHHLWVAEPKGGYPWDPKQNGGLYSVDTQTLTAVPITPPSKDAFQNINRVFQVNGDWWVLATSRPHASLWHRQGVLWRKEPQALAESESEFNDYGFGNREGSSPSLKTPQGTWLIASGAGLWWVPRNGNPAVRADWRRGVSAGRVNSLFRLPGGNVLTFGDQGETAVLPPIPPPLLPARPEISIGVPGDTNMTGDMLADPHRHLWGLEYLPSAQYVLDEWDGKQWHNHSLPKIKSSVPNSQVYACDTRGRIWLTISVWNPPAQPQPVDGRLVYDPVGNTWAQYPTVPDALQAAASLPGMAFLPYHNTGRPPIFSGDGRVAYLDGQAVFFYDGKIWRHWKNRDIQPSYSYGNEPENPRFNSAGHLEITLDTHAYEWTPETGWAPNGIAAPVSAAPPLPPGGPAVFQGTPVTDNLGGEWLIKDGAVYLTRHGLWRKETALSGPGSPFWDGRRLTEVLQDPYGHLFFLTIPGNVYEYVVWSPPAAPLPAAPRIQITPLTAFSVKLRFAASAGRAHWFQWRLNGGPWNAPQTTDTAVLPSLLPGAYRVEAQTIDARLQASPKPSAAVFVLQPASAMQIARWVQALLSGTENAREAAVAGLVKQPADALPALQAARPGASEDGRWWLDAAIQQITDQNRQSENTGQ